MPFLRSNGTHTHRYWGSDYQLLAPYRSLTVVQNASIRKHRNDRTKSSLTEQHPAASSRLSLIELTVQIAMIFMIVSQKFVATPPLVHC